MKVAHILGDLGHSGAERMLECSFDAWRAADVDPLVIGMSNGPHSFAQALVESGYRVSILPPVRSFRGQVCLGRTLRSQQPDIVHIHSESCFDAVAAIAASTPGVNGVVRTVHSNFAFAGALRARRRARVALARRLGVVWVACSPEVAETERSFSGCAPTLVVENWVDVERIVSGSSQRAGKEVRRQLGISEHASVVAVVGGCGEIKNHTLLAKALSAVSRPVHVLHAGSRRNETASEAAAWRELGGQHEVHHLGERSDVPALLAASDLLAQPSLWEGFCLAAAEALCAGVPVLAGDCDGLRWLASTGSTEVAALDAESWAAAIERMLAERPDAASLRSSANVARRRFDKGRGVAEYLAAYRTSLRASRRFR